MRIYKNESGIFTFKLKDHINFPAYSWPETLLTYPVDLDGVPFETDGYKLTEVISGREIPWQLLNQKHDSKGAVIGADLVFLGDLPSSGERIYRWEPGESTAWDDLPLDNCEASLIAGNGNIHAEIVNSRNNFGDGDEVPAPVICLGKTGRRIGRNRFQSGDLRPERIETTVTERGPVVTVLKTEYFFEGGGCYSCEIKIIKDYPFIDLYEKMEGISEDDGAYIEMVWTDYDPAYRFGCDLTIFRQCEHEWYPIDEPFMTGDLQEDPHWYNTGIEDPSQEMYFRVLPYSGNSTREVTPNFSFWEEDGDELGLFILDSEKWDDREYGLWQHTKKLQISFRYSDRLLYWKWPVSSGSRSMGISLTPVAEGVKKIEELRAIYCSHIKDDRWERFFPDMKLRFSQYLHTFYGALSLDRVKDWVLEYPETGAPPLAWNAPEYDPDADEYMYQLFETTQTHYPLGLNMWPGVNSINHRHIYYWVLDGYRKNREFFTPEQKQRIDALLLFTGYINTSEDLSPIRRCMGGCPNMQADGWAIPAQIAALFPDHPKAGEWFDFFEQVWRISSVFFTRPEVEKYQSLGGRWTESLGVYNWAQLAPTRVSFYLGLLFDGKNRWAGNATAQRCRWLVDMTTAPIRNTIPERWGDDFSTDDVLRHYPSYGSHGTGSVIPLDTPLYFLQRAVMYYDPLAAEHLMWMKKNPGHSAAHGANWNRRFIESPGSAADNSGTNPHLKSCKYTGHGIVLRAGVGTADEVSIHLNQIDRGPNYRWGWSGEGSCGSLYFYADQKVFTAHEHESTGDRECDDTDGYTTFGYMKNGSFRSNGKNVLEKPLYDFKTAQFAEIVPRQGNGAYSWPEYKSRNILLAGTDYFILADEPSAIGRRACRFSWFTSQTDPFPEITYLAPSSIGQRHAHLVESKYSRGFFRESHGSKGHFALVSAKKEVKVKGFTADSIQGYEIPYLRNFKNESPYPEGVYEISTPGSRDFLFRDGHTIKYVGGDIGFQGQAGLIRFKNTGETEVCLFKGTSIECKGMVIQVSEPGIGISVSTKDFASIEGDLLCPFKDGGEIRISLPHQIAGKLHCYLEGEKIEVTIDGGTTSFDVPEGRVTFELSDKKPKPAQPVILYTNNQPDGTEVHFTQTAGAEKYEVEISRDVGVSWDSAVTCQDSPCTLNGLDGEQKIHVRVTGGNSDRRGDPSDEYPVYISQKAPHPPEGLSGRLEKDTVHLAWGQVLGSGTYCLYRKGPESDEFVCIYEGRETSYVDREAIGVVPHGELPGPGPVGPEATAPGALYVYMVRCENGNGAGEPSYAFVTDSASWLSWYPAAPLKFKRDSEYYKPPYVSKENEPPQYY